MAIILGLIIGLVFFIVLCGALYAGILIGQKKQPAKQEIDDDTKRRQEQLYKGFIATMSYSPEIALQRKKVTHE